MGRRAIGGAAHRLPARASDVPGRSARLAALAAAEACLIFRALAEAAPKLTSASNLEHLLRTAVDALVADFGAVSARLWLCDAATGAPRLGARSDAAVPSDLAQLPAADADEEAGWVAEALGTGLPCVPNGPGGEAATGRDGHGAGGSAAVAALPLFAAGEIRGVLVYVSRQVLADELLGALAAYAAVLAASLHGHQLLIGQQATRAAAERFAGVLRAATEYAIIATDAQGVVTVFNEGAERMLGYRAAEVVGRLTPLAFHDAAEVAARAAELDLAPGMEVFVVAARHGKVEEREWTYVRKDGSRLPVALTITATRDERGQVSGFIGIARDTTRRRCAEQECERLAAILEATTDFVGMADLRGHSLYVNRAGRKMLGLGLDEDVTTHDVADAIPESERALIFGEAFPAAARDGVWEGETLFLTREGREIPISQVILAHKGPDGRVEFFSTVARDITERNRVALELERLSRHNQLILNSSGEGIFGLDSRGRATFVNPAAARMVGYEAEELLGRPLHELLHHTKPDGRPYPVRECPSNKALIDGAVCHAAGEVFWRKDGTPFPVEFVTTPIHEGRRIVGCVVTFSDITEREQAEEDRTRLLAQERSARAKAEKLAAEQAAILGQIADGVVTADSAGRITFTNRAAQRFYPFTNLGPLAEGRDVMPDLLTADGRPYPVAELPLARAALRGETVVGAELRARRPNGTEIVAHASATPVGAEDGTRIGAVMTLHDVTAQRDLERHKDEFFASVSHDLRTPVTAIKASIGVVLANEPQDTPEPLHRMLVNIDVAADRMAQLVDDLLELTRLRVGRVQLQAHYCDLRELALRSTRAIEPLAQQRGQRVELRLPPGPYPALADADRLERALLNLLDNAYKYGRAGGLIRLSLERRGGEALFAVADDGPGISERDLSHVFDRFYRSETEAARRHQGSGLGLPIARAMVELHGGRVWVESKSGAGTTFWIALPTALGDPAAGEEVGDENSGD